MKWLFPALLCVPVLVRGGDLTPGEQRGREIYRRGAIAGLPPLTATIGGDGVGLPAASFACANCHGLRGEGGNEGGVAPPSLNGARVRTLYTDQALARAIVEGLDSAGTPLSASMPRYQVPPEGLAQLVSYLRRIGDEADRDPGVTAKTIRIGAALPLSGPLAAAGRSIRETLEAVFSAASRDGGVYGRTIQLVVEDSRGDPQGTLDATRRLVASGDVFALAGSFEPDRSEVAGLLAMEQVPLVGPAGLSPHVDGIPNPFVFYLLPNRYDQMRAAVDFIVAHHAPERPRISVLYEDAAPELDGLSGLRAQAAAYSLPIVTVEHCDARGVAATMEKLPDLVVVLGGPAAWGRLAKLLDAAGSPTLLGFLPDAQGSVEAWPPALRRRTLLLAPALPPTGTDAPAFFALLKDAASRDYLGLRSVAFASGSILLHCLRLCGSQITREGLIRQLEALRNFETGVIAPVTFSPNRRVGNSGAALISFDNEGGGFVPASGWIIPREVRQE